jgi:Bardet-Biedl syndrome 4 protein
LKRALYLDPFEWIISYNLGLVHLNTDQYASAFHYLSASINLKPDFPSSYMYLGITLSRLDDFENACSAYEKAIRMERSERRPAPTACTHKERSEHRSYFAN